MMVRALHSAGIEVILDVVYNHSAEGEINSAPRSACAASTTRATTVCLRKTTATTWIFSGCGNSLNMQHPRVLQLIVDSLRYWVSRDARRRIWIRPRECPRPGALRGQQVGTPSSTSSTRIPRCPGRSSSSRSRGTWGKVATRSWATFPDSFGGVEWEYCDSGAAFLEGRRRRRLRAA